jgi:hypothetical protein
VERELCKRSNEKSKLLTALYHGREMLACMIGNDKHKAPERIVYGLCSPNTRISGRGVFSFLDLSSVSVQYNKSTLNGLRTAVKMLSGPVFGASGVYSGVRETSGCRTASSTARSDCNYLSHHISAPAGMIALRGSVGRVDI